MQRYLLFPSACRCVSDFRCWQLSSEEGERRRLEVVLVDTKKEHAVEMAKLQEANTELTRTRVAR